MRRDTVNGGDRATQEAVRCAVIAALLLTMAFGPHPAATAQNAASPTAGNPVEKVALITPDSRTNQGWDQQAVDSMTKVGEERQIEVIVADNAGYDDITPTLRDFASQEVDLVVCHASGYQTVCPEFAEDEQTRVAVIENPPAVVPGLVSDIETQAQDAAYLAGVLAGQMTTTGTVGIVVSGQPPTWNYMAVGFAEGLNVAKPDARLLYGVIGEAAYADAVGGKRETEAQLAAGADIIFGMGDGASFGMIEAVEEHNADLAEGAKPAMFIDVIGDKRQQHGDVLLTSVLFDFSGVYAEMLDDIETGAFGKIYTLNVENGGVRLLDLPESVPEETVAAVEQARQEIIDGTINVSAVGDAEGLRQKLDELFPDS